MHQSRGQPAPDPVSRLFKWTSLALVQFTWLCLDVNDAVPRGRGSTVIRRCDTAHVERHVRPPLPDGALEPPPQHPLQPPPEGRHKAKEACRVGDDSGGHEDGAGEEDQNSIEEGVGRNVPVGQIPPDPPPHIEPLGARQERSDHPGEDNQSERRQRTDPIAQLDQKCEFDEGDEHEEREELEHKGSVR